MEDKGACCRQRQEVAPGETRGWGLPFCVQEKEVAIYRPERGRLWLEGC